MSDKAQIKFVSLTPEDLSQEKKKLSNLPQKKFDKINKLFDLYVNLINEIISKFTEHIKNLGLDMDEYDECMADISYFKSHISSCPNDEIFIYSKDKFSLVAGYIINSNEQFFLNYLNDDNEDTEPEVFDKLRFLLSDNWNKFSNKQKLFYWDKLVCLISCIDKYKNILNS